MVAAFWHKNGPIVNDPGTNSLRKSGTYTQTERLVHPIKKVFLVLRMLYHVLYM